MNWGQIDQQTLFETIGSKMGPHKKLATEISEVLTMSPSNVYKKLKGTSLLTIDQVIMLCKYYKISFDDLFLNKGNIGVAYPFYSDALAFKPKTVDEYWINIGVHLRQLVHFDALSAIYLANEIPFFYYLHFPNLLSFKTHVWNKVSWKIDPDKNKYNPALYIENSNLLKEVEGISKIYNSFPSIEIWNPEMLRLTFMQLRYFIMSKSFNKKEDIEDIIADIRKLVSLMQDQAKHGKKKIFGKPHSDTNLTIYLNQLSINSEIILIQWQDQQLLYNKYDSPNYIRSNDPRVTAHMSNWLNDLIAQSTQISNVGQRDRDGFFSDLNSSLDRYLGRIKSLMDAFYTI